MSIHGITDAESVQLRARIGARPLRRVDTIPLPGEGRFNITLSRPPGARETRVRIDRIDDGARLVEGVVEDPPRALSNEPTSPWTYAGTYPYDMVTGKIGPRLSEPSE